MFLDGGEHFADVVVGVHFVYSTRRDDGVQHRKVLWLFGAASEERVFASQSDDTQLSLRDVVVCLEKSKSLPG
jgi:hypothetical protein